ncbi:cystatin-B-like [Ptychodera flava]|uniref:cystatin-B-like n=1 Tax=Ptychodera flava TaxID=63121 RepID=UPI00396A51ED
MADEVMIGEWSKVSPPTPEVQAMLDSVKDKAEDKAGLNFDVYKVKTYSVQVVTGKKNYRVKVDVGDDEFIHVRMFEDDGGKVTLRSVQINKTVDDVF